VKPVERRRPVAAIVDYGLGNVYSVRQACLQSGLSPFLATTAKELASADVVLLPGVGAFGDAMAALRKSDLVNPLRDASASGRPLFGICLGMQLLFSESAEFGCHPGLNILTGVVRPLARNVVDGRALKIPQVGWNQICRPSWTGGMDWSESLLAGLPDGAYMYFVHSFFVDPETADSALSLTTYGSTTFCSSVQQPNVLGCQFHPERSGPLGLRIYDNIATLARSHMRNTE
jgi:glutamine amidotransferase